eukprot:CAMPEP_0178383306 /NCGR_PEP_ID=MMETSP0689_2-20121128/6934_1 /TAXON_ID=160604 /ORGANISM="Amphidinium massartii, Strain CS-259" /LENGTH=435 /DNA_ID=CAMNT_0020003523 /DNA_START=1 /DNA_END=1308 /DNA_ORIENTATION=-
MAPGSLKVLLLCFLLTLPLCNTSGLAGWPRSPSVYKVDLDTAGQDRWNSTVEAVLATSGVSPFADYYTAVLESLRSQYPSVLDFYETHLDDFKAVWHERYHDSLLELHALSDLLQQHAASQEERQACSRDKLFLAMMHMQIGNIGTMQECTSVVLRQSSGDILHFRNWDFLPLVDVLGELSVDIDFTFSSRRQKGFRCLLAMTHIHKWTTCMRDGEFSMSLNARPAGIGHERGRSSDKELELLRTGMLPRVEVLKRVMLSSTYEHALVAASTAPALTSMYVILAAPTAALRPSGAGAVVTLRGNATSSDVMPLPPLGQGWFIVQTNVDHSEPMGQDHYSSHRREHMKALLVALGPDKGASEYYATLRNSSVYPDGNTGPDDGRVFRDSTIASVFMRPGGGGASPELCPGGKNSDGSWRADVWRPMPSQLGNALMV